MRLLLDTNVLLPFLTSDGSRALNVRILVLDGARRGLELFISPQIVFESWNVLSRPAERNGIGLTTSETADHIRNALATFQLLPDIEGVTQQTLELAFVHRVVGRQIHDARLAATVLVNKLDGILTFNAPDFKRYGIKAIEPGTL